MPSSRLRIAIQSKGRLYDHSIEYLRKKGLEFKPNGRNLVTPCVNREIDILLLRNNDIPEYVNGEVADFGIVGENVLIEKEAETEIVRKLGFGHCRLVIAVPENSGIRTLADLEGERIATSYPQTLRSFLQENSVHAAIIPITGSVEVTPELNLADAICDITQTGTTLQAHRLRELVTILKSEAVLIRNSEHAFDFSFLL